MTKNLTNLIALCNERIKGYTKIEELENFLPITAKPLQIFIEDKKMFFTSGEKVSYIWAEGEYFSNLEILKRIGYVYKITLKEEGIFALMSFSRKMKLLAKKLGVENGN